MKSFSFLTDIFRLNRTVSLDFTVMLQNNEVEASDTVRINYDAKTDTLTGVVVANGQQFGHVFEPTSFSADAALVKELDSMKDQD